MEDARENEWRETNNVCFLTMLALSFELAFFLPPFSPCPSSHISPPSPPPYLCSSSLLCRPALPPLAHLDNAHHNVPRMTAEIQVQPGIQGEPGACILVRVTSQAQGTVKCHPWHGHAVGVV